jgi:hypothetical protein
MTVCLYAFICNSNDFIPSYVDGIGNSEAELLSVKKEKRHLQLITLFVCLFDDFGPNKISIQRST